MNILMPQLGETVSEGTISKWYKVSGDAVVAGEILFEIETDKTSMEVPALAAGVLHEVRVQAGQTVPVGAVVAVVTETAAATTQPVSPKPPTETRSAPPASNVAKELTSAPAQAQRPIDPFHGVRTPEKNFGKASLPSGAKVTPLARRLAAEAGVDLARIQGSGPRERIVAADVRRAAAQVPSAPAVAATRVEHSTADYARSAYREVPLDSMRKTIARRLSESKQQVPHFYLSGDLNVEALLALRKQINEVGEVRVSVNDLMVKAYALALQRVPMANVVWATDRLLQFERSDVGVAVAVPGGLVTPVIRSADTKSVIVLAAEVADLVARARERKLQPAEYAGGAATVSNLGMYGVRNFQAIVNPPQATILAVGAAERRPVEKADGTLGLATMLTVSISVDHRAVDGAIAGELLAALRKIVEQPVSMFL